MTMTWLFVTLPLLLLNSHIITVRGANLTSDSAKSLYKTLFQDYEPHIRPALNESLPVEVRVQLYLTRLYGVNVLQQSMKTSWMFLLCWRDEYLTWNPGDNNNVTKLVFPYEHNIWVPDISVYNALQDNHDFGLEDAHVKLNFRGEVMVWTTITLDTTCEAMTKRYPLDENQCDIMISPVMSTADSVLLTPLDDNFVITEGASVTEWDIVEHSRFGNLLYLACTSYLMCEDDVQVLPYSAIMYRMKIQRKCMSCIMNIMLPIIVLAALNLLTFIIPCESGEKTSFPISLFLTLAVFLTMISSSLPESIDGLSYISMFVTFNFMAGATTLLATVISIRLHHRKGENVSKKVIVLLKPFIKQDTKQLPKDNPFIEISTFKEEDNKENADHDTNFSKEPHVDWCDISRAFDKMMLTVMALCETVAFIVFLALFLL